MKGGRPLGSGRQLPYQMLAGCPLGGGWGGGEALEGGRWVWGGWYKALVFGCLPLAAPIGLSPMLILGWGGGGAFAWGGGLSGAI